MASSIDSGTQLTAASDKPLAVPASNVPDVSYSSSEDEDFFDAEDDVSASGYLDTFISYLFFMCL